MGTPLQRRVGLDGRVEYRSAALSELGVPHLFTTRLGPGRADLDLTRLDPAARRSLLERVGLPQAELVHTRQVHGAELACADGPAPPARSDAPRADALATSRPDRVLAIRVADCVPVLLAARDGAPVAAAHAGWRGLVAGVLPRALEALGQAQVAAIGPCLCREHFEVGEQVAEAFVDADLAAAVGAAQGPRARPHVDLRLAAQLQLTRAGVRRVDGDPPCTWEHERELFSHRRDVTHGGRPSTGRMAALIGVANG